LTTDLISCSEHHQLFGGAQRTIKFLLQSGPSPAGFIGEMFDGGHSKRMDLCQWWDFRQHGLVSELFTATLQTEIPIFQGNFANSS